jgi:hypothetical protein
VQATEARPEWIVCYQITRTTSGPLVRCPRRGMVLSEECLRCRFLTTSSVERTIGPWCEASPLALPPAVEPRPTPRPEMRPDWPLQLPVMVPVGPGVWAVEPAVRPAAAVPSGQAIGT